MTRRVRPALPAAALLSLAVAACQAPVRPDPTEPAEPVAVVAIRPAVVATPPVDAEPPPPPPVEPDPVEAGDAIVALSDRRRAKHAGWKAREDEKREDGHTIDHPPILASHG